MNFGVLHEDNHLLVVDKAAGLLVQADRSQDSCLVDEAKSYLKVKYDKPGNVYLGLIHRLDRNVSGVVLLARTSKAASRLSDQFRRKSVAKTYLAVTEGKMNPPQGDLKAWLAAEGDHQGITRAENQPFSEGKESLLSYRVLDQASGRSLIEVRPVTGRRHQIRAQLTLAGCPLVGDVKYGATRGLPDHRIALHAQSLEFDHPVGGDRLKIVAPLPEDWPWPARREFGS
jgi:23S rRNA pseudouridine1911/1915/1917 synthase